MVTVFRNIRKRNLHLTRLLHRLHNCIMQGLDLPQYERIAGTVAGTTTVLNRKGNLHRLFIPTSKTGTATFYDSASGTSATSYLFEINNSIAGSVNPNKELGFRVKDGLTVVTGGTTDFIVVYE